MSQDPADQDQIAPSPVKPLIGEKLKAAREARGLTVDQISARLNITNQRVHAIEADDFDALPGVAFARGYLRSYARVLEVDGDELVRRFNESVGDTERTVNTVTKVRRQASSADPLVRIVGAVLVLALLGFSLWWWQAQTQSSEAPSILPESSNTSGISQSEPAAVPQTNEVVTEGEQPANAEAVTEEDPVYLSEEEVARLARELEQAQESEQSERLETAAEAVVEPVAEEAGVDPGLEMAALVVTFNDDCWVTLKTGDQRTLVARTYKAGDTLSIDVQLPADLLLGNASAVASASLNGEALAVAENTRRNLVRLSLTAP